jgi:hypothetical protein
VLAEGDAALGLQAAEPRLLTLGEPTVGQRDADLGDGAVEGGLAEAGAGQPVGQFDEDARVGPFPDAAEQAGDRAIQHGGHVGDAERGTEQRRDLQ